MALLRLRQGLRVLHYQRNLRRLPTYVLRADKIPVSQHKLFLGRGFAWTQRHTQIVRHITHIEPLLRDYCAQWLPRVAPEGICWPGSVHHLPLTTIPSGSG